jgi:tetratricopeptide (TPR) repeat protein
MAGNDGTADHPTGEQLRGFVYARLKPEAAKDVARHLFACADCREAIAPLAEFLVSPKRASRRPSGSDGAEYEFPLRHFEMALRRELKRLAREREASIPLPSVDELLAELLPPARRFGEEGWVECETLLGESWELRYDDPDGMVSLAQIAAGMAQNIDPATRGPQALADLQARALAALGNARRVANDPHAAEWDLRGALERFDEGTGDRLLLARLMSFTGSVFLAQRRFEEADAVLSLAFGVYEEAGERHKAGKVLWQKGVVAGYAGDPARAVRLVEGALTRIDAASEPEAALHALHSLVTFLIDCGRFDEASEVAWSARALYAEHGGELLDIKLLGLEGRIAAGRGLVGRADRCFREARRKFLDHGMPYTAAIVALDLGVLLLECGRAAEAKTLVEETVNTFKVLGIPRETSAALILLSTAVLQDRLTIRVLRTAAAQLQKMQG